MKAPGSIDGYHCKIDIRLGKDDGLLSFTGLRFTLNRYDTPMHGLPDLNCEDTSILKDSIFSEQGSICQGGREEHRVRQSEEAMIGNRRASLPAVQQRQTAIVAAQSAFETIIENPLLAVLKFNADKTQTAWDL